MANMNNFTYPPGVTNQSKSAEKFVSQYFTFAINLQPNQAINMTIDLTNTIKM